MVLGGTSRGGQRPTAVKEGVLDAGNAHLPNHYYIVKPSIGYLLLYLQVSFF